MIIDMHSHIGKINGLSMTDLLIPAAKKHKIDFTIFSNGDAVEFTDKQVFIENGFSQIEANLEAIEICKRNANFGCLLWLKPYSEGVNQELIDLIEENKKYIYGLKFHPFYSNIPFDDSKYEPYIELARKYDYPILIHTAADYCSNSLACYNVAKKNPDVKFILAHMGLGTDNLETIKYIKELPNLYGDTAWVSKDKIILAIRECGADKIMFGTDNPIDGIDTYFKYSDIINMDNLDQDSYDKLMYKNAMRVFKINA